MLRKKKYPMNKSQWLKMRERRERRIQRANDLIKTAAQQNRAMTSRETEEHVRCHQDAQELLDEMKRCEIELTSCNHYRMVGGELVDQRRAGMEDISHRPPGHSTDSSSGSSMPIHLRADRHFNDPDRRAFRAWLRGGPNAVPAELRCEMEAAMTMVSPDIVDMNEVRAMSVGTPSAGGYMVPQSFLNLLDVAMKFQDGMMDACDYWDTENGATAPVPSINDTSNVGERVAEGGSVTVDVDPAVGSVNMATYNYCSKIVKYSIQLGQDSAFNLEQMLLELLTTRITNALVPDLTTGDGSSKPRGILTDALAGPTIFPATTIGYADLIDLEYSVDRAYRNPANPKCGYMMHDSTLKVLRKLTDDNNNPLFRSGSVQEGLATNREPDRLNGWPVFLNQSMPTLAQGAKTVLFGDFSKYLVRRVRQIAVVRLDQLFMANLQIGLLAFGRFGGLLRNASAGPVRYLTQGTS
jgi:HK97 family phage major capsid protein